MRSGSDHEVADGNSDRPTCGTELQYGEGMLIYLTGVEYSVKLFIFKG